MAGTVSSPQKALTAQNKRLQSNTPTAADYQTETWGRGGRDKKTAPRKRQNDDSFLLSMGVGPVFILY